MEKAAAKVDRVAAKMAEQAARHEVRAAKAMEKAATLDRFTERHARTASKAAAKAEVLARVAEGLGTLDLWTRTEPAARRPRLNREAIAATAARIADTEGFDALSMRRLAAELDAGTMTLYHYVRTKDELLALVVDFVMGELLYPPDEPMPSDWREALTGIAGRTRAALERHPWIIDITDDPPLGPNSVRHFDQTMQAVASLDLPPADRFDIVTAVDEYVFGYCLHHRNFESSSTEIARGGEMIAYVNGLVETGDYPQLALLAEQYGLEEAWRQIAEHLANPDRFDRNLRRLLDGIEADLQARPG
ncbi:MAG: putative tetR-family regulatory protein [Actinomycetia bacterium]|nr:putative tetR-family regulatory protein [Actinomycetes bacterium]